MSRYWLKTWMLVDDDKHDEIPNVTQLQDEIDKDMKKEPSDGILAVKILAVAAIKPPDIVE